MQYSVQTVSELVLLPANLRFGDSVVVGEEGVLRQYLLEVGGDKMGNMLVYVRQNTGKVMIRAKVYIMEKTNKVGSKTYESM